MSWYRHRLERDLQRWQAAGWVTPGGAGAIRNDLEQRRAALTAAPVLAVLGAVLFGFAVMSFVAAHWTGMSKLARLALLVGALWACYAGAALLFQRQLHAFAHAAVLGGIAVWGASIMLIAQMYHMEGNPPDALLLWTLGALLAAVLARSAAALGATFVLLSVWCGWERLLSETALWSFLIPWSGSALTGAWLRWRPALHLAAVSLLAWLVPLGFFVLGQHAHWLVILIGIAGAAASQARNAPPALSAALFFYGLAVAYAGLFILQFLDDGRWLLGATDSAPIVRLVVLSILALALLLAAMLLALKRDDRGALWLAYGAFALEIFMLYVRTFGSFLNTSLFFLVAALLVTALAWLAWRLHQAKTAAGAGA
ncbi:MAG TPA: DUF2157 domain-containing protein [Hyphomicrobiaceae bacterium]|nr:DUF2157 domain-containing protein [Hyphomicrobiaceae bacterium]